MLIFGKQKLYIIAVTRIHNRTINFGVSYLLVNFYCRTVNVTELIARRANLCGLFYFVNRRRQLVIYFPLKPKLLIRVIYN